MNVLLFGATGMIGTGVLLECLEDPRVERILSVSRSPTGRSHPKLTEILRRDFLDFGDLKDELSAIDACFFCLGVSSAGMDEESYSRVTYEPALAAAGALASVRPGAVFCYVSGEGTDSSEAGRTMWARVKGRTENALLRLPLDAYMFRPGYVQPLRGARSKTRLYRMLYLLTSRAFPLLERVIPEHVTTTVRLARAMIAVAADGHAERILENADINALGRSANP